MSSSLFENIFSSKLSKKPLGDQQSTSFDVIKTNRHGKKQERRLCFANDGVRNMDRSNVKWYLSKGDLLGFARDTPTSTSFTMLGVQRFHFDAKSEDQLAKIFESIRQYSLGSEELAKKVLDKTVCLVCLFCPLIALFCLREDHHNKKKKVLIITILTMMTMEHSLIQVLILLLGHQQL